MQTKGGLFGRPHLPDQSGPIGFGIQPTECSANAATFAQGTNANATSHQATFLFRIKNADIAKRPAISTASAGYDDVIALMAAHGYVARQLRGSSPAEIVERYADPATLNVVFSPQR